MIGRLPVALGIVCIIAGLTDSASDSASKVRLVYDQALPNAPGKSIRAVLVEYGPGGASPAHTHPRSAFIYATVLEGAIRSQVNDGRSGRIAPAKVFPNSQAIITP
jgi:quercetin dioxygenase-like cupin family protein